MRLICPNCGAQYEVADGVIPDEGRDVQCSNCGQTWFESPQAPSAELEENPDHRVAVAPDHDIPDDTEQETAAVPPPPPAAADEPPAAPVQRTQLDPSIADILREEAAREEAARRAESNADLEQQGDLGLGEPAPPPPATPRPRDPGRDRLDRLQGRAGPVTRAPGARSEVFPDIEEINSTLRASAEREDFRTLEDDEIERQRHSGRRGFFVTLALIAVLALIYVYADPIAARIPALAGPLAGYVDNVDAARLWLDLKVQGMLGDPTVG